MNTNLPTRPTVEVDARQYQRLLELRAYVRLLADPDGTYAAIGEVRGDPDGYVVAKLRAVVAEHDEHDAVRQFDKNRAIR